MDVARLNGVDTRGPMRVSQRDAGLLLQSGPAHVYRAIAPKDGRNHGDAVLRKRVGRISRVTMLLGTGQKL